MPPLDTVEADHVISSVIAPMLRTAPPDSAVKAPWTAC